MTGFIDEFRDVLERGRDLPTLPQVVLELHAALDNEMVSHGEIAAIVNQDPPLATRILRLANSAAFNVGTPIGDIGSAMHLLGIRHVRVLCVALSIVNVFSGARGVLNHRSFWGHSTAVALTVRELARCLGYSGVPHEHLYVGGLLHDVGLLLLDQYFPRRLRDSLDIAHGCDEPLWKTETFVLGTDHGEIVGLLLGHWHLPSPIVSMVAAHHHPLESAQEHRDASWLLYAAEIICGGLGPAVEIERLTPERATTLVDIIQSADYDVDGLLDGIVTADQRSLDLSTKGLYQAER